MAKQIGNSQMDAHNARAKEFAENEKIGNEAATKYIADKGYSESSIEAAQRANKANSYRNRFYIGQHGMQD